MGLIEDREVLYSSKIGLTPKFKVLILYVCAGKCVHASVLSFSISKTFGYLDLKTNQ